MGRRLKGCSFHLAVGSDRRGRTGKPTPRIWCVLPMREDRVTQPWKPVMGAFSWKPQSPANSTRWSRGNNRHEGPPPSSRR